MDGWGSSGDNENAEGAASAHAAAMEALGPELSALFAPTVTMASVRASMAANQIESMQAEMEVKAIQMQSKLAQSVELQTGSMATMETELDR